MDLEELRIRADEARMLISSVELRLDFLDHFPVVKKLYSEAMTIATARLNFYEKLISEREGNKT
jgi:hypothetical protein